jgi:uncharacterized protein
MKPDSGERKMFRKAAWILSVSLCTATFSHAAEPARPPMNVKPSFDCTAVKSNWKLLVCGDDALAALDLQEDTLLRRARTKAVTPDAVNAEQDLWVSERDACTSAGCLTAAYRRRIRELHNWTN